LSFTVTPLNPDARIYHGAAVVARGRLWSFGGFTSAGAVDTLSDHYAKNRLLVRAGKAWQNNLNEGSDNWSRFASFQIHIDFRLDFWDPDSRVLLILDVEGYGPQDIQVFVGTDLIEEKTIDGRRNVAILYDVTESARFIVRPKTLYKHLYFYKASVSIIW
jgi:hypothetical protein